MSSLSRERKSSVLSSSSYKDIVPSWGFTLRTSSKPNYLPKAPLPGTITVEVRTPTYDFNLFYFILFYFILFYFILFYFILFYFWREDTQHLLYKLGIQERWAWRSGLSESEVNACFFPGTMLRPLHVLEPSPKPIHSLCSIIRVSKAAACHNWPSSSQFSFLFPTLWIAGVSQRFLVNKIFTSPVF